MDNKKRVLQVNLDGTGGAFSLIYQIQKIIGNEFVFDYYWMGKFADNKACRELKAMGSKFFEADLRKNRLTAHFLTPFHFYKFLQNNKYDIVHINADTALKHLIYAYPAAKAGCKRVIIHSHSSEINGKFKSLKKLSHDLCKPFLIKYSTVQLTCSKLAAEWMFGNKSGKAVMINNGVDIEANSFNEENRKKFRDELGVSDRILIGSVGNLSFVKYPEYLIDIFQKLDQNKYRLIFVGDGPDRPNVEAYAKSKNVADNVIFYGQTPDVHKLLSAMDIFIMTSRFEGLPVSGVEAQTNGLKCIFSDRITPELKLLPDAEFASIDGSPDKWAELIEKAEFMDDRKKAAEIVSQKGFNISDTGEKLKKVYDLNIK